MSSVVLAPARQESAAFVCAAVLIVAALLFGGGPRGAGDAVVQVAMLPCLALAVMRWDGAQATRWERVFAAWCLCVLALVGDATGAVAGSVVVATAAARRGVGGPGAGGVVSAWHPMTLDAWATVRAGWPS
jgi:hypothetical protein